MRSLALAFLIVPSVAACHDWSSLSSQYGAETGAPVCVAFVVTGDTGTCARRADGSLLCWGDNRYGQLGVGDEMPHAGPQPVTAAWNGVAKVYLPSGTGDLTASQSVFACIIDTQAGFWCWGDNSSGQLGDGTTTERPVPVQVTALGSTVKRACVGAAHACAGTSDGAVWCWGANASGQLGTGDTNPRSMPTKVVATQLGTTVDSLQCGAQHTCAHRTDGTLWCWGSNAFGQLGVGDTTDRSTPTQVIALGTKVGRVGTGGTDTCAFTKPDGSVWCWGNDASGQLGVGDTMSRSSPAQVMGLSGVTQVWTGGAHNCALDAKSSLWCWGDNRYGQLGTGDTSMHDAPVLASPAVASSAVAGANAGGDHTCALRTDGAVLCWGNDQYGQLGAPGHATLDPIGVFPACP